LAFPAGGDYSKWNPHPGAFARREHGTEQADLLEDLVVISSKQNWLRVGLLTSLIALPGLLLAADRSVKNLRKPNPDDRTVEMFDAIEAKEIEVKLIPKDDTEARVLIKNNTKKPLNVKLPDAFAGRPVLAQRQGGGGGSTSGGGGQNQSMGGGMGGGMMGGGGMGGGGGMFSVPPEQVGQFKVATVCLEHGKKEPRPNIPYEIVKIEEVSTDPAVKELLTVFGKNRLSQRATQAAAWHLANGMSWQELAGKRIVHINGTSESWFNAQEIQAGMEFATIANSLAAKNAVESPSENQGLSRFQPVSEE
jgi:hypothetical protein